MVFATSDPVRELTLVTRSDLETRALGESLGRHLERGDCIAIKGAMGAGKTVLAQGIVAGAGGGEDVRSPTFLLHAVHLGRLPVHHLDLYRLEEKVELRGLGVDEALEEGAVLVEWPERARGDWFTAEVELRILAEQERALRLRLPPHLGEGL